LANSIRLGSTSGLLYQSPPPSYLSLAKGVDSNSAPHREKMTVRSITIRVTLDLHIRIYTTIYLFSSEKRIPENSKNTIPWSKYLV
jgi:hypothetical protein